MSADPYKSRLFNLINRRFIHVKDNLGRISRRGQNAIALAVQIVLYPIYLLVQSARVTANQLGNTLQKQLSPPSNTAVDPIEKFLHSLSDQEMPFIGIAADIEGRALVFVTSDSQTVKITDNQTQKQLEKQISTALANYAVEKRKIKRLNSKYPPLLPNFTKNEHILPPIRWFWQLLRWEQQGQIAIAIDLFKESHLVTPPTQPSLPIPNLNPQPILEIIDQRLANFEAKFLVISPEVPISFREIVSSDLVNNTPTLDKNPSYFWRIYWLIYAAIAHFWAKESSNLEYKAESPALSGNSSLSIRNALPQAFKQRLQDWLEKQTQEDPFTISKLIQAAIDHFFSSPQSLTFSVVSEQPWLESADILAITPQPEEKPLLNQANPTPKSLPPTTKKAFSQEKKAKSLQKITSPTAEIVPQESPTETKLNPRHSREIITAIHGEWLETESTPVGYVKHPLERILERLDAVILWMEELVIKIWRWLRREGRNSKSHKRRR